jgi:hypothetical protein
MKVMFISYQGIILRNSYQVAAPVARLLFMNDKIGILLNNGDLICIKISTNKELVSVNTGFGRQPKIIDGIYADGPKVIALLLSKNMPVQHFLLTSSTLLNSINFSDPNQKILSFTALTTSSTDVFLKKLI